RGGRGGPGHPGRGLAPRGRPARGRGHPGAGRRRLAPGRVRPRRVRRGRRDAILRRRGDALSGAGGSMNPTVVAEAKAKARDYFSAKGTLVPVAEIQGRLTDAFGSLDALLAPISAEVAARTRIPGEWTIQEVVDHLVETHRPG